VIEKSSAKGCKLCGRKSSVIHTSENGMRRRFCASCNYRWTTIEINFEYFKKLNKFFAAAKEFFQ
jgi:transcriptional regulator NrdR family protein